MFIIYFSIFLSMPPASLAFKQLAKVQMMTLKEFKQASISPRKEILVSSAKFIFKKISIFAGRECCKLEQKSHLT